MLLLPLILALTLAPQSTSADSIRDVDFKNFTYPKLPTGKCATLSRVRVRDGKYGSLENFSPRVVPRAGCWQVSVAPVIYGDVTGDRREEAIVILYAEMGGTESSNDVFIYTLRNGRPVLLWKFWTGDRAEGGLLKLNAENGQLVVELAGKNKFIGSDYFADDGTANGACCPTVITRSKYRWIRGAFRRRGRLEVLPFKGWDAT
ncbi:MAG TPA: hypothetical protein VFD48_16505 [Pyrinomonadaceae bacterium]|nr:hypothetical protein [Pyrinomonadaceae bacterium]